VQREVVLELRDQDVTEEPGPGHPLRDRPLGHGGDQDGRSLAFARPAVLVTDHVDPHQRGRPVVDVVARLLADLHQQLAARELPLRRVEHDGLDGQLLEREIPAAVRLRRLPLRLAPLHLCPRPFPQALELALDLGPLWLAAGPGALQGIEHRPEEELDLGRVDRLGLLPEELALQPLQLIGDEDVELLELVPLVLGHLGT